MRIDSGLQPYIAKDTTSRGAGINPGHTNNANNAAGVNATVLIDDNPVTPRTPQTDREQAYVPQLLDGDNGVNPGSLSLKIRDTANSDGWQYSDGGTINIMAAILLDFINKFFPMFAELQSKQFQANSQLRLANTLITNYAANITTQFAIKTFNKSKDAATWELVSAVAGAAVAVGGAAVSLRGAWLSNKKEINALETTVSKTQVNEPDLTSTAAEIKSGNYKALKPYAENNTDILESEQGKFTEQNNKIKILETTRETTSKQKANTVKNLISDATKRLQADPNGNPTKIIEKLNQDLNPYLPSEANIPNNMEVKVLMSADIGRTLQKNPLANSPTKPAVTENDFEAVVSPDGVRRDGADQLQLLKDNGFINQNGEFNSAYVKRDDGTERLLLTDPGNSKQLVIVKLDKNVVSTEGALKLNKDLDLSKTDLNTEKLTSLKTELNDKVDTVDDFDPQVKAGLKAGIAALRPNDGFKEFEDEKGNVSIFGQDSVVLPKENLASFLTKGELVVYRNTPNGIVKGDEYFVPLEARKKYAENYELGSRVGLDNELFVNKSADNLAKILDAPNAKDILGEHYALLKTSASRTYQFMRAADLENTNEKLMGDAFAEAKPGMMAGMPGGKLNIEIERIKRNMDVKSQVFMNMSQLFSNFSTSASGLLRSRADQDSAFAQYLGSMLKNFSDTIAALTQATTGTVDAIAATLRDLFNNVAKILEFYSAVAEATKSSR